MVDNLTILNPNKSYLADGMSVTLGGFKIKGGEGGGMRYSSYNPGISFNVSTIFLTSSLIFPFISSIFINPSFAIYEFR